MNTKPTRSEAEDDLAATCRDEDRLVSIVVNLREFVEDSHGENRANFKAKLMLFEQTLQDCRDTKAKIKNYLASL